MSNEKIDIYQWKMEDILKLDQFEKLNYARKNSIDFTRQEENRINGTLNNLHGQGEISEELLAKLKSTVGQPNCLSGVAKAQKNNSTPTCIVNARFTVL